MKLNEEEIRYLIWNWIKLKLVNYKYVLLVESVELDGSNREREEIC